MRENRFWWFGHVRKRPVNVTIRWLDSLAVIGISMLKERPKKTWIKKVRNDLKGPNLTEYCSLPDWKET